MVSINKIMKGCINHSINTVEEKGEPKGSLFFYKNFKNLFFILFCARK
jgi:hypothetical protein